ncbi:type I-E CRISPR-associated protein Cse2/CasB [Haloechinothrix sp. LS1_15]|nr:type I-E CRISPR-associated protein Cse2/CasB [Haloechinothrix sp. LS1_15]
MRSREHRELGRALEPRIDRLQNEYLRGSPSARADLAQLRRGLGKPAGSVPEIWEHTIGAVPESMAGSDSTGPSRAEQAAHAALTLFSLHLQSQAAPVHWQGVSFGWAVGLLAQRDRAREQAITRRFMAAATAQSVDELLVHVRGLIDQLKAAGIGVDYAAFAGDIAALLTPARRESVRLVWGRDFYRVDSASGHGDAGDADNEGTD